jgi:hypothetical protein
MIKVQSFLIAKLLLCLCVAATEADINSAFARDDTNITRLPDYLTGPQMAWGEETNDLRAGLDWGETANKMDARVLVLTFRSNVWWDYVAPPGKKFLKLELQDAHGVVIRPIRAEGVAGELPARIDLKDLPRTPEFDHHGSMTDNRLLLSKGIPIIFRDFRIQDVYKIEEEGDYTLKVWVSVYKFQPDDQPVQRIDLLPVTVKLHLEPSQPITKKEK